ncbi:helix-turn-helix transcriptional regulator [Bdellovibrio sp. 22V]|uniref:helix-turn-helix domain-containing protein n=1 Tax=Bdellovibrio TaxID=958 RepID=UPI0025427F97|nr:helix-turn-helix transcriptional regulator [Bdellovibrio sp. 22V]WII73379.1 helix-turn-helix transcriptional regulator [Bdellovibrio sp. 22V]
MASSIETKYDKVLKRIAKNIKELRKAQGLSQRNMEAFGFDLRNYQRLEAGKHSPSVYTLHKLAVAFRVDISDLLK